MSFWTGLLKGIKGGPDAARYNTRDSYDLGYKRAKAEKAEEIDCVFTGMAHALTARYMLRGLKPPIEYLQLEGMPFVALGAPEGVDMIIEYIVWKDYPDSVDFEPIKRHIASWWINTSDEFPENFQNVLFDSAIPWVSESGITRKNNPETRS